MFRLWVDSRRIVLVALVGALVSAGVVGAVLAQSSRAPDISLNSPTSFPVDI